MKKADFIACAAALGLGVLMLWGMQAYQDSKCPEGFLSMKRFFSGWVCAVEVHHEQD